jgi:hypothetical protein
MRRDRPRDLFLPVCSATSAAANVALPCALKNKVCLQPGEVALTGRPLHKAPAQDMKMEMIDRLPAILACVQDGPKALFRQS